MRPANPNYGRFSTARCVDAFAEVARPLIRTRYPANRCIAATKIAIEVFGAFGISAKPMVARFFAGNRMLRSLLDEKHTPTAAENALWNAMGAVGKQIGFDDQPLVDGDDWNRHLVALVDRRWVVDASADQAANPSRGLVLPGVLVTRLDHPLPAHPSEVHLPRPDGVLVEYAFEPSERSFRTAPDWEFGPTARATAAMIGAAMNTALNHGKAA